MPQLLDRWTIGYSPLAVKQFAAGKPVENKPNVQACEVCEVEIASLLDVAQALTKWQQGEFLLHGAPVYASCIPVAPGVPTRWPARTFLPRTKLAKPGKPQGFAKREHYLIVFDLDKLDGDEVASTLEERVHFARSRLPDQFRSAECVGVLSASAGFKAGVRTRLFFWNDRPTLASDLARYFKHAKHLVDTSIYQEHQMIFCAGPQILDATPDPFPQRVLHIAGDPLSFDPCGPSPYVRQRQHVAGEIDLDLLALPDKRSGFDWSVAAPEGGRNNTIYQAARSCHAEGLPFEQGLARVQAYNEEHCKPPLDETELERTVQSAYSSQLMPLEEGVLVKQVEKILKQHVVPASFEQTFPQALTQLADSFHHGLSVETAEQVLARWLDKHQITHVSAHAQRPLLEQAAAAPPPPMEPWRQLLDFNEEGTGPKQNLANVQTLMREHPDLRVVVDTNTARLFWVTCPFNEALTGHEARRDEHEMSTRVWVSRRLGDGPAADKYTWPTLLAEAYRKPNRINYLGALLRSLKWDGVVRLPRIAEWAFGCQTDLENRAMHLWFAHAARRALFPGTSAEVTLVLKGPEGIGKSHFVDRLGMGNAELISRLPRDFAAKDTIMSLRGRLVVTADELEGLRGREAEEAKEFLTRYRDVIRLPYRHDEVVMPRTCSFIASTNEADGILTSETGNRRFVVLECQHELPWGQFEAVQAALLWAEAVATYATVPELTKEEKLQRQEVVAKYVQNVSSELQERVTRALQSQEWTVAAPSEWKSQHGLHTLSGAFICEALNMRLDSVNLRRVAKAMRALGWEQVKTPTTRLWQRRHN